MALDDLFCVIKQQFDSSGPDWAEWFKISGSLICWQYLRIFIATAGTFWIRVMCTANVIFRHNKLPKWERKLLEKFKHVDPTLINFKIYSPSN
jgi:hypothetical protein